MTDFGSYGTISMMLLRQTKTKIAVLAGGPSSEYEVSLATAKHIISALNKEKYEIKHVRISKKGEWHLGHYRREPKKVLAGVDVVFNALHGHYGEDGQVQSLLNKIRVPYTGAGAVAAALAMDKLASRKLFVHAGLTVPKTSAICRNDLYNFPALERKIAHELNFPVVVKPNNAGSSVGVNIVFNQERLRKATTEALKFGDEVLAEEFIKGVEVTAGVLETKSGVVALPTVMIMLLQDKNFFDYQAKYDPRYSKEIVPAPLGEEINKKIQTVALKAHRVLGLRHYSRTDMIVAGDKIYVLETDALPGLTATSLLPKALSAWGMDMNQFVDHVVELVLMGR